MVSASRSNRVRNLVSVWWRVMMALAMVRPFLVSVVPWYFSWLTSPSLSSLLSMLVTLACDTPRFFETSTGLAYPALFFWMRWRICSR